MQIEILNTLGKEDADKWNFVRLFETFVHYEHTFLVFELLGMDLREWLNKKEKLAVMEIRPIVQQVSDVTTTRRRSLCDACARVRMQRQAFFRFLHFLQFMLLFLLLST